MNEQTLTEPPSGLCTSTHGRVVHAFGIVGLSWGREARQDSVAGAVARGVQGVRKPRGGLACGALGEASGVGLPGLGLKGAIEVCQSRERGSPERGGYTCRGTEPTKVEPGTVHGRAARPGWNRRGVRNREGQVVKGSLCV